MTIQSMTGFARAEGAAGARRWTFEVKSVNARGLELRFRMPSGLDAIENEMRKAAGEMFARGSITTALSLDSAEAGGAFRIDRAALDRAIAAVEEVRGRIECDAPRAEAILALRGVVEADESDLDDDARLALSRSLIEGFRTALAALKSARLAEGKSLAAALGAQIAEIDALSRAARGEVGASLPAIRQRIAAQLQELFAGAAIPEERLAQEAALLAIKADIREELDRLAAHIDAARGLLEAGGPQGRGLDFLAQEFNREANTLCSKAQDIRLKRIGLELKTAIDQFREQVQNIE